METGNEASRMLLSLSCLPLQWLCVQERKHWRQQTLQPHPTLWTQISLGWRRQWQNDSLLCRMRCNSCPCRKNLAQSTKHWHVKCIILFCGNINSLISLPPSLSLLACSSSFTCTQILHLSLSPLISLFPPLPNAFSFSPFTSPPFCLSHKSLPLSLPATHFSSSSRCECNVARGRLRAPFAELLKYSPSVRTSISLLPEDRRLSRLGPDFWRQGDDGGQREKEEEKEEKQTQNLPLHENILASYY